jgi:hypothetical protein
MKCDSHASLSTRTFVSPYLGHKPKAMVATKSILIIDHNILKQRQKEYVKYQKCVGG